MSEFCIHYPHGGMAMNDFCKKGIDMRLYKPMHKAPCHDEKAGGCPLAEYPTAEQIAERNKHIAGLMENMFKLMEHKSDICYHCGKQVKQLEKVGRCVYARPCGCRLWQGSVPKEWKRPAPAAQE